LASADYLLGIPVSFAPLFSDSEPIEGAIPLTAREKRLKEELERVVRSGLETFVEVAQALRTLRTERLYRATHPTFESYCQDRFGLGRIAIDQTIRAGAVAQTLLAHDISLPPGLGEGTLRPLCGLPDEDLQVACWELAEAWSPSPTQRLVTRLCRTVKECLQSDLPPDQCLESKSTGRQGCRTGCRKKPESESDEPFIRPVIRMAACGFSVEIVVASVGKADNAANLYRACGTLIARCRDVQEHLARTFPNIAIAPL
jgi:hypothetical protein